MERVQHYGDLDFFPSELGPTPWAPDPSWILQEARPKTKSVPKILLVDDDPVFCKILKRAAKKRNLDVTVCKTFAEVTGLSNRPAFDVVVLDYYFGELTASQLVHLLGENMPVVLISNTEARKISGDGWPEGIRTFLHKSAGVDAILSEALVTAHWQDLATSVQTATATEPLHWELESNWWLPFAAIILGCVGIAILYFFSAIQMEKKPIQWDKAPLPESTYFSQTDTVSGTGAKDPS